MNKGFTLIELIVVIGIVAILSTVILFSVTQYIGKGKDTNILGNLAILIPAGEAYYNGFPNKYGDNATNFCNSSVVVNVKAQLPEQDSTAPCYDGATNTKGVCCNVESLSFQAWAACARKSSNINLAFCVDSRGIKKEIPVASCTNSLTQCP